MNRYICLDIGGTYIKYGVMSEKINFLMKGKTKTLKNNITVLSNIKSIIKECIQSYNTIHGICISSAGIVDSKKGKIISATLIPNYSGLELKSEIEKEFGIKCEVENDVNCVGISENYVGEAKETSSSVCITVGTGIGGCIIINNKIINGFSNSAGELGYMHIRDSRFSKLATTSSLVDRVSRIKGYKITGEEIFELAKFKDEECIKSINEMIENLAIGIANIIYIINPEVIILGGGIMEQEEYIKPILEKYLENNVVSNILQHTKIKFAKNQNDSGMIGALQNFIIKNK